MTLPVLTVMMLYLFAYLARPQIPKKTKPLQSSSPLLSMIKTKFSAYNVNRSAFTSRKINHALLVLASLKIVKAVKVLKSVPNVLEITLFKMENVLRTNQG